MSYPHSVAPSEELLLRARDKQFALQYVKPLVHDLLKNHGSYRWSLQGFGMLRAYISKELRVHVWNRSFAVPNVTTIHDHPWHFESVVVAGTIVNTRYRVRPCHHTDEQVAALRLRAPFIEAQIICGTGGGNKPATLRAGGRRVWLDPLEPTTYGPGDTYRQQAQEIHHTSYADGTVTLVSREFLEDTEHAHVFFKIDEEWVSAEPRDATPDEVQAIVERALIRF